MKNQINNDERVLAQKRKVQSAAFVILFIGMLISALIRQVVFKAPVSQYISGKRYFFF